MPLTPDEIDRYARHLVLQRCRRPRAAEAEGARGFSSSAPAGLGAPLIQYLAAAGVGTIGIVDDDAVSLSNLQRQVIHGTPGCRAASRSRAPPRRSGGSTRT